MQISYQFFVMSGLDVGSVISSRVFPKPTAVLYEAFSHPEQLVNWWGPKGFTNTFHVFDFKPGGVWRFTMHAPDGTDYEIQKTFVEVVPCERIVFDHKQPMHSFRMTILFEEVAEGTRITWRMDFESPLDENLRSFLMQANEENFDRLANFLEASHS